MQQDVEFYEQERSLTAYIKCEIDHHTARGVRERIDAMLFEKRPELLIMDFAGVRFMDSSGIGLILGRVETANATGATVRLTGLSPSLMKLLRLSGIERVKNLSLTR